MKKNQQTISAIIIAKNAENVIADCIDSLSFCDEVLVVDNGSIDHTSKLAKHMRATMLEYKSEDFSDIRNYGLKKAKGDWVIYIDTDERVTDTLREDIQYQISNIKNKNISAYKIKRKNFYFGDHEWPQIEMMERFFKKDKLKEWKGKLHESPIIIGEVGILDGFLLHYTHRNLTIMLIKTIEWSETEAKMRFDVHHPQMTWWRFPRVMVTVFFESYIKQRGWKIGIPGIIESIYQSFSIFITYAKLWEKQQNKERVA